MIFPLRLLRTFAAGLCLASLPLAAPWPAPTAAAASLAFVLPNVGYTAERQVQSGERRQSMRVYYAPGMERMELDGAAAGGNVVIVRYDRAVTWVIMPRLHAYIELPAEVSQRYLQLMQGLDLTPAGHSKLNGIAATKYRVSGRLDGFMWLDRNGIPLKVQGQTLIGGQPTRTDIAQTDIELTNPSPAMFELPAGLARIQLTDPAWIALLQRYLPG